MTTGFFEALGSTLALAEITDDAAREASLVFAELWIAWLGLLIPLAIAAYVYADRRRKQAVTALGNPTLIARLIATVDHGSRTLRSILVVAAMSAIVLGLMRLQYGGTVEVKKTEGLDIVLAVDYSKSMLAQDVYPSRSERLESELTRFLDLAGRRGDRVGVVVFAGEPRPFALTPDMRLLSLFLERADPRTEEPGGTAIAKALDKSIDLLVSVRREGAQSAAQAGEASQVVILLTDGEDTLGDPLKVAAEAARLGIRIYTVGIGSKSGVPIMALDENGEPSTYQTDDEGKPIMTRLDSETLEALAEATDGQYVQIEPDHFALDRVTDLMRDLERAQREDALKIHREEGFRVFALPGLILLCIALALGDRRAARAPKKTAAKRLPEARS